MICTECGNSYFSTVLDGHLVANICPECYDMNHNNSGHGFEELDEHQGEDYHDEFYDDENDDILAQQELEDFERADEYYGQYDDDYTYDNDRDFGMDG